ncbi:MAG: UDP-N-acetylmuramate--L-alanine ligase [Phycisphaerae bacterium]|nr:UDP-N-acetylmuramate--L-alanine ligase [Phycisphaerae bacterium]
MLNSNQPDPRASDVSDRSGNDTTEPLRPVQADPIFSGKRLFFIGIGGSGMSGLARMLATRGAECSGSDQTRSSLTDELIAGGMPVSIGPTSVPSPCDLVIASAAIKPDHPEYLAAEALGIEVISYAEALGRAQLGRTAVSIAGTHGKSTTTAMLAHVLMQSGLDPSVIVGATVPQLNGGSRTGSLSIPTGPYKHQPGILVCEACEFNRSFHHHRPTIALVNNVEEDHLDCYGSLDEIVKSFRDFAERIPASSDHGRLLIAYEGAHRREIASGLSCDVATFGFSPQATFQVVFDAKAGRVGLLSDGVWLAQWDLQQHGDHMALNSAAAAIIAHWLGADWEDIAAALATFLGVDRRMQKLGTRRVSGAHGTGDVTVYDDYGHHPTECEKTLCALRAFENPRRLICVFQPHQHSRTRFLLDQFATSFESADIVIVPHIYFVRDSELEKTKVSASDLVDRLIERGIAAMHLYPFAAIVQHLEATCRPGDLVIVMGAGPVNEVAIDFLRRGQGGAGCREGAVASAS